MGYKIDFQILDGEKLIWDKVYTFEGDNRLSYQNGSLALVNAVDGVLMAVPIQRSMKDSMPQLRFNAIVTDEDTTIVSDSVKLGQFLSTLLTAIWHSDIGSMFYLTYLNHIIDRLFFLERRDRIATYLQYAIELLNHMTEVMGDEGIFYKLLDERASS